MASLCQELELFKHLLKLAENDDGDHRLAYQNNEADLGFGGGVGHQPLPQSLDPLARFIQEDVKK